MFASLCLLVLAPPPPQTTCNGAEYFACQSNRYLRGIEQNDHLGLSVSACGDWNWTGNCATGIGDPGNRLDVLAGAAYPWEGIGGNPTPGRVQLYTTQQNPCDVAPELVITGDVILGPTTSENKGEAFGWSVAFIGDLDEDCRSDFAVGAPRSIKNQEGNEWTEKGRVYIFLSSKYPMVGAYQPGGANFIANSANLIIEGEANGHQFGFSIAENGDFNSDGLADFDWNNDGVPDLIVGAPGGPSGAPTFPGRVYVISGLYIRNTAVSSNGTVAPTGNVVQVSSGNVLASWTGKGTTGLEARDRFGFSVAVAGEVGDPDSLHTDIVVGAPQFSGANGPIPDGQWGPGYVRVLYGSGTNQFYEFVGPGTNVGDFGCFGYSVAGQIDIPPVPQTIPGVFPLPDGNADILVGEPLHDVVLPGTPATVLNRAGRVYVLNAKSGNLATGTMATAHGRAEGWFFGWTVEGLGKINGPGDPFDSWAVCASRYGDQDRPGLCSGFGNCPNSTIDPGDTLCGRLFVFHGNASRPCWSITGESFRDSCGWGIARTGDLDGGSLPDLCFSSPRWAEVPAGTPGLLSELGKVYIRYR